MQRTQPMTARERFHAVMNFQPVDRHPLIEWAAWWGATIDRWHADGLPAELKSREDIMRYFGLDMHYQDWVSPFTGCCPRPAFHGAPIITSADHYESLRPSLYPSHGGVINAQLWQNRARLQRDEGCILWFTLQGFFWYPRTLLGIEPHLFAFYDQAELMHRMNEDLVAFNLRVIDEICAICKPDFMTFAEDMSYNNGPMISEGLFDEFMLPYYQRLIPRLKEHGVRIIVDSDGDISTPAAWFERAGVEGILPLERQAGVDMSQLRKRYPKQLYLGGYDKMVMPKGEAAMRAEFERLMPVARQGGYVISVDHQTPPGVSLENYKTYVRLFKEYGAMP